MNQQIVCDHCHEKLVLADPSDLAQFIAAHEAHNFTGLRVVNVGNPCPNRARDYALLPPQEGDPPDIEALAAAEHEGWAGFTRWMIGKIEEELTSAAEGGKKPIYYDALLAFNQTENVQRWRRQMDTPYAELSEREMESDRRVAREKIEVYRTCFK